MAHFKLNEADETFLAAPQDAVLIFAGASGTETWIERNKDVTVRIVVKSVATATGDNAALEVCIQMGDACARGQDGPSPLETQLRASQSVQVVVKAGERLNFKAYPNATNAKVLRTVIFTADMNSDPGEIGPDPASSRSSTAKPDQVSANAS